MLKLVVGALGATLVSMPAAVAQQEVDSALFEQGQQLYEAECALCHQAGGLGNPPTFPALSGNDQLSDLGNIVSNIHQGQGNMPPFPDLTAEQIAALATYIRNSWGNAFGGVMTEEVAAVLEGVEETGAAVPEGAEETAAAVPGGAEETAVQVSVWDGVYTEEQAERGEEAYMGVCSSCHGRRLDGAADDPDMRSSPPLARANFLREWDGRTIGALFEYTRATMPVSNPGFLSDQEYIDIIAHMLAASNIPAGEEELPLDPENLAGIVIEQQQ